MNNLKDSKSAYLRQHAQNPVNWYAWGEEAFKAAKAADKPLFVSIGYSTCHWCHVMRHESFENQEIAEMMNESFISIKIDREERPDLDEHFMKICQLMNRSCGWPLNVILTPGKMAFLSFTYLPPDSRFGRPGLRDLIEHVNELWENQRETALEAGESLENVLESLAVESESEEFKESLFETAFNQLENDYDPENGGFGFRPKFPMPLYLLFLLRYAEYARNKKAKIMAHNTLRQIVLSGTWDLVGGGIHRYSTDEAWHLPHFEKMLYDQALISMALIEGWQATGDELLREKVEELLEYVSNHLSGEHGAFFAAEDADTNGEEGKYYLWSLDELSVILTPAELESASRYFSLRAEGNFKDESKGIETGDNILDLRETFAEAEMTPEDRDKLSRVLKKLKKSRTERERPFMDKKVLTDWNGLMIAAFARAGMALRKPEYIEKAEAAADYIIGNMLDENGRLYHVNYDGEPAVTGFLDDYAFFMRGLLELFQANSEEKYLDLAVDLMGQVTADFSDEDNGVFFFTGKPEEGIGRTKKIYDGVIPSGNSAMMMNLLMLSRLTGNSDYDRSASRLLNGVVPEIIKHPGAYINFLSAALFAFGDSIEIVIAVNNSDDAEPALEKLGKKFIPFKVILVKDAGKKFTKNARPFNEYSPGGNKPLIYICRNGYCEKPVESIGDEL